MNGQLLQVAPSYERAYARAALRECIEYGEHGQETEIHEGKQICFNCGWQV